MILPLIALFLLAAVFYAALKKPALPQHMKTEIFFPVTTTFRLLASDPEAGAYRTYESKNKKPGKHFRKNCRRIFGTKTLAVFSSRAKSVTGYRGAKKSPGR
jgi:hypothetical protein